MIDRRHGSLVGSGNTSGSKEPTKTLPALRPTSELTIWSRPSPPLPPSVRGPFVGKALSRAFWVIAAGLLLYGFFFRGSHDKSRSYAQEWQQLAGCSETVSLDGKKLLHLFDDGHASLENHSPPEEHEDRNSRPKDGAWKYDEDSKNYSITFNGETTAYSLVSPEHLGICMLVYGNFTAADLTASWFSTLDEDPGDYDYTPDRY
jgi:hypothetical protein